MTNLNNHFHHSSLASYYRSPFRWYSTKATVVTSIDQRYMQRCDPIRFDVFLPESFRLHALDAFRRQNPTSRILRKSLITSGGGRPAGQTSDRGIRIQGDGGVLLQKPLMPAGFPLVGMLNGSIALPNAQHSHV